MVSNKRVNVENKDIEPLIPVSGSGGFASNFLYALDPKKRVTIPAVWRLEVGDPKSLYILPGLQNEQCLYAYPAREMARRLDKFRKISISDRKARLFARMLASNSELVTWDSQGRIRIKDELLAHAGIGAQVQFVGAWDRFELWNPDVWRASVSTVDKATLEDAIRYVEF